MAAILVLEDYELNLVLRALNQYKDTIFPNDDLDNNRGQAKKMIDRIKTISVKKRKGGQEL